MKMVGITPCYRITLENGSYGVETYINTLPAVRAVFDAVRGGRKRSSALGTTLFILGLEKLCIQQLIKGQYGGLKPFAKKRIGNKLRADTFLPVVQ